MPRFGCLSMLAALVFGFVAGVGLVVTLAFTSQPTQHTSTSAAAVTGPRVPNVVGRSDDRAQRTLRSAGYRCDEQREPSTGLHPRAHWRVVAQQPAPASPLRRGATVKLTLRRG